MAGLKTSIPLPIILLELGKNTRLINLTTMEKGNYYYTTDGLYVRLVEEIHVNNITEYVVIDEEELYDGEETQSYERAFITSKLFENESEIPSAIRKSELQKQVGELYAQKLELEKATKELETQRKAASQLFNPVYKIGDSVYSVHDYSGNITRETIKYILFELTENGGTIRYRNYDHNDLTNCYLTEEEAKSKSEEIKKKRAEEQLEYKKTAYENAKKLVEDYEITSNR